MTFQTHSLTSGRELCHVGTLYVRYSIIDIATVSIRSMLNYSAFSKSVFASHPIWSLQCFVHRSKCCSSKSKTVVACRRDLKSTNIFDLLKSFNDSSLLLPFPLQLSYSDVLVAYINTDLCKAVILLLHHNPKDPVHSSIRSQFLEDLKEGVLENIAWKAFQKESLC